MVADPLSEVLKLVDAENVVSGGFTAGGSWAIRFPAEDKIKFAAIVKGNCWVQLEGEKKPLRFAAGDALLLAAKRSFIVASDLAAVPHDAKKLFFGTFSKFAKLGRCEEFIYIGGHVQVDPANGALLSDVLPSRICIRANSPKAPVLRWLIDQLICERKTDSPGSGLAAAQLAQLILVQILRAHLETSGSLPPGWLRALGDRRIATTLRLMHGNPARSWHLKELAKAAAMSRTSFALQFKTIAGIAPLAYLSEWRMQLARRALNASTS
jgi:AraC-like DNA-binding protein